MPITAFIIMGLIFLAFRTIVPILAKIEDEIRNEKFGEAERKKTELIKYRNSRGERSDDY